MSAQSSEYAPAAGGASFSISDGRFRRACREMDLAAHLEQALIIREREIVTDDWAADSVRVASIAERVRSTWSGAKNTSQIQYYYFGEDGEPLLLLTKPVNAALLTLAARSTMAVSRLRRYADELTGRLLNNGNGPARPAGHEGAAKDGRAASDSAYAIAWRPVEPIPPAMRSSIREGVQRLARENGCHPSFVGVASDHVHLVLNCPSHRSSSWAAFAFKNGIEKEIWRRYDTTVSLWRKGYLANPSTEPLAGEELLVYLGSSI